MPDDFDETGAPLPPQDGAAERIVLGAVMDSGGRAWDDLGDLRAGDFYWPQHAALFALLQRLIGERAPVDPVAVLVELQRNPIRGVAAPYLHTLVASVPSVLHVGHYAGIVRARASARAIIRAGQRVVQVGYSAADATEMTDAVDTARRLIDDATSRTGALDGEPLGVSLGATIDALLEAPQYVATPWIGLDEVIGGWAPGRLYAVGARPAVGKSVLGLQAAAYAARNGIPAVVFTLEMSKAELNRRLLAQVAEVPYKRIDEQTVTDDDMRKMVEAQGLMYDWPLRIIDTSQMSVPLMRQALRHLSRRRPVGLVVLDYLQLMASPAGSKAPRQEVVADFSRSLKLLAKEFDCPVICISQLNRNSEQRADKLPGLADLRESGAIEQDCDVVLLLHREHDAVEELKREKLMVSVAKNRHGATGAIQLRFEGWFQRATTQRFQVARNPADYITREAS